MALINLNDLSIDGWTGDYATYDGSTKIRMISILGSLAYFIKRPLFGLALGSTYAHSTMATVLASIGIIGTYFWIRFTFYMEKANKGKIYNAIVVIWLILLVLLGEGLFPFYGVENIVILYIFKQYQTRINNDLNFENVNTRSLRIQF